MTSGPNAGQTGSGITGGDGTTTWTYADNGGFGTDAINASATVQGHAASDTAAKDWTDQPLTATGTALTTAEGQPFTATVATFTDPFTKGITSDYSATIDWGDGSTSAGAINGSAGQFTVGGTHTYQKAGTYPVVVTIKDKGGSMATAKSSVTVHATQPRSIVHGTAKLMGVPRACVRRGFTLRVKGSQIAAVTWFMDGRRVKGKVAHRGSDYRAFMSASPGKHRMTVKTQFLAESQTKTRTFHAPVSGCQPRAPKFTG